ncbi:MAG: 2-oxoacid:acceptor oxidoreductase subunit alpha [Verrucomicrobiae bacterium]|nr:2-oxoacid:acceptor oxidoreductase subunit alpha [Verrucomicrobiae bacterium]MCP5534486.1 2-oxoacid:acceptor oxidoreductase subunit alpha [Akkermansiaceae bacterium]MCP5543037.1 2-oxoacid:acceptor oxidoreductase subunit alpha [Akkermansiaceae bacterium]
MSQATRGFREKKAVVVRFAGDSGDGMQVVGERFTEASVTVPNAIATFPDYPAEIRAPVGTIAGVSAFQVHFGSETVLTPGDEPDALVAMNPAALAVHLSDLTEGGMLIANTAAFTEENLAMAGYKSNPLEDPELQKRYEVIPIDITGLAVEALKDSPLSQRDKLRTKNFFALGFTYWVYGRPIEPTIAFIEKKWGAKIPDVAEANTKVLKAGYFLGETTEITRNRYMVARAEVEPGIYRKISGNEAVALGLIAASRKAKRGILFSGYPITPASSILEAMASFKHFGVKTVQAEDEIAAIGVALGGSFAGHIGVTGTSGPGMCLKSEFIGLATSTELPLVIINVQRGGPSTGLPTKTEQSDLFQALYGRHGESPLPVVAANSPSDCFRAAFEATRIALQHSTPVILLTDGYLANGSEPWKIPDESTLPDIEVPFAPEDKPYVTFERNPDTLARTQAIPGQPGLQHRIGGLEKDTKGSISYDPENHSEMTRLRAAKVEAVAKSIPPMRITGERTGKLLVVGWGGTHGAITSAVETLRAEGFDVSSTNVRYLNPLPPELGDLLKGFDKVLVPELNSGQLCTILRARYLVDAVSFPKTKGRPFRVSEIRERILELLTA